MPTLKDVAQFLALTSEQKMAAKLKVSAPISTIALIKAYEKLPPRASFKQDKTQGTPPITVQFTDKSTGYILKREWKFGDGKTDNTVNPSHTYTSADCENQFPITLTVSSAGGSDTAKGSMWVYPNPPKVKFAASAWSGVSPLQVTFVDDSEEECVVSRVWDFGDGGRDAGNNPTPTHVFHNNTSSTVQFRVSLEVTAQSNNPASWAGMITVTPAAGTHPPPPPPATQPVINAYIYTSGTIEVDGSKFPPNATIKIFEVDAHGNHSPLYTTQANQVGTFGVKINVEGCDGGNSNPLTVVATGDNGAHFSNQAVVHC
jgi:PKD repeat protein